MDTSFNEEEQTLTVSLSVEDSLALLAGGAVEDSVDIRDATVPVIVKPMDKKTEQFREGFPIGSEKYIRALGYKSSSVVVRSDLIDITIPRTLLAANQYPSERVPYTDVIRVSPKPSVGDVRIRYADLTDTPEA